jgi:hypothetical protein
MTRIGMQHMKGTMVAESMMWWMVTLTEQPMSKSWTKEKLKMSKTPRKAMRLLGSTTSNTWANEELRAAWFGVSVRAERTWGIAIRIWMVLMKSLDAMSSPFLVFLENLLTSLPTNPTPTTMARTMTTLSTMLPFCSPHFLHPPNDPE